MNHSTPQGRRSLFLAIVVLCILFATVGLRSSQARRAAPTVRAASAPTRLESNRPKPLAPVPAYRVRSKTDRNG